MSELERCRVWIEAALEHSGGSHTFDDVAELIREGKAQLWPAPRGCAVTEIVVYPRKRVLHIFLAGGELSQLRDMFSDAAEWAKAQGCEAMSLSGRVGWARAMAPDGWMTQAVVMERTL